MNRPGIALVVLALISTSAVAQHSDWPKYCGNMELTGVAQSGGLLSVATAGTLHPLWTVQLGGPIASSPTLVGDQLYVGDWTGFEYALDADLGLVQATADLGTTTNQHCEPATIGITSAATVAGNALYVAGGDDSFYALDASTLRPLWKQQLGDNSERGGYYGWCSPVVVEGNVLQGVSSNCDDPFVVGQVVSLDSRSGRIVDAAALITPEWPRYAAGAGVWTSPAVDMDARKVFVATGSAPSADDGLSFAMVRLSLDHLDVEDYWKLAASATEDADWGSSPTLFVDDAGQQLVGAGQKDGSYYAFRRTDLASGPIWIAPLARGGACPLCSDGILSTAAFDGSRLYVGTGQPLASPASLGSVSALDPATGHLLWQTPLDAPVIAPISYANGVVFTTAGNHALALDAENGHMLWSFETEANCVGGIAITDRGIFFGDLSGRLYAFGANAVSTRTRVLRSGR